jgi:hypothetical protein
MHEEFETGDKYEEDDQPCHDANEEVCVIQDQLA